MNVGMAMGLALTSEMGAEASPAFLLARHGDCGGNHVEVPENKAMWNGEPLHEGANSMQHNSTKLTQPSADLPGMETKLCV